MAQFFHKKNARMPFFFYFRCQQGPKWRQGGPRGADEADKTGLDDGVRGAANRRMRALQKDTFCINSECRRGKEIALWKTNLKTLRKVKTGTFDGLIMA